MADVAELPYEGTIHESLRISAVSATADEVVLEMPVTPRVHQPLGLLHGGASAVLAESAASIGGYLSCDPASQRAVGVDLNITHLRPKESGTVRATATPVRKGRSVQVWAVDIADESGVQIAVARLTLAIKTIGSRGTG